MQKICEIPNAEQHLSRGPQFVDLRGFSIKIVTSGRDDDVDMVGGGCGVTHRNLFVEWQLNHVSGPVLLTATLLRYGACK